MMCIPLIAGIVVGSAAWLGWLLPREFAVWPENSYCHSRLRSMRHSILVLGSGRTDISAAVG